MRILALDWGTVRIGAAVSDETGTIATPVDTPFETKTAIAEIKTFVENLAVEKILVGMPKSLSGENSSSSEKVEKFVGDLRQTISCPIESLDERFSSVGASKTLAASGISQKNQRGQVDNLAAAQMLQAYLDKK